MINKFVFVNDHLILPVILTAVALLLIFTWKEWAQSGRRCIFLKIILALLAICSLALIALKPASPTTKTTGNFVLLTEGFKEDQLDSLKNEHRRLKILKYDPEEPIAKELESAEKIFILGHGIKDYDLWQLDGFPVTYLGGISPEGITNIKFPQEMKVGDSLILKGIYKDPRKGNQLVLRGPGGAEMDSLDLDAEEDQHFRLATVLKVPGNFIYSLSEKDKEGEVINSDPLPVKVAERENLKILVVNSYPTFETKYLKNFLAEAGHELIVRSQITRGRFKFEYFNTDRTAVDNLSEVTLEPFDLLIIDAASLRSLSGKQVTALENSVKRNGLGLFIQPDDAFFRSPGKIVDFDFERVQQSELSFPQWPGIKLSGYPYRINEDKGLLSIQTSGNFFISAYRKTGDGRIGTTVLADTWQLILDGKINLYRQLWSQVVEQVSKRKDLPAEWEGEAITAFPDEPFKFKIRTLIPDPEITTEEGNFIPIMQDINISSLWTGTIWPREMGWKKLQMDTTSVFDYYVTHENDWSSLSAVHTRDANQPYFDREESIVQEQRRPLEPISLIWFFGLFLLAMSGLWLEPKI